MAGSIHKCVYFAAVFVAVLMSAAAARADTIDSTLTMRAGLNDTQTLTLAFTAERLSGCSGYKVDCEGDLLSSGQTLMNHDVFPGSTHVRSLRPFTGPELHGRSCGIPLPLSSDPFSLTQAANVAADKPEVDPEITPAPEPATMLLVGAALLLGARMAGRFVMRR